MAKAPINLSDFAVVKFGNPDIERNYINDILHAIVSRTDDLQSQIGGSGSGDQSQGAFVLIAPEASEPNGRGLVVETGVLSLNDGGPGTTIVVGVVTNGIGNTKLAQMPALTFKANKEVATGNPEDITATQATAMLDLFAASTKGLVPPPGLSPAANWYLHYDGTWSSPGGGTTTVASVNSGTGITVDNTNPSNPIINITNTAVTPAAYGDATHWPTFTVNAQGQLTLAGSQAAPAGVSGANPTASVGLAAVNGAATTFMRSDGAPALSQAIVPTWSGIHTFTPQAVFTGGLTTGGNVTILTDIVAGSGNIECGSLGHVRTIGGWTTYASVVQPYIGFTADADPPAIGRVFVSKGDNTAGKIDALQLEIGTGNTAVGKGLFLNGFITPTALASGNTDDWNPTGLSTACVIRVTPNASGSTLRGITAPTFAGTDIGKTLHLLNVGSANLTLLNQSIGSTAANRLILGSTSLVIAAGQGIVFWYDSSSSRWRVLQSASSGSTTLNGGITTTVGTKGTATPFTIGSVLAEMMVPNGYTITGWQLACDPSATMVVEVKKCAFGSYPTYSTMSGTSTSAGGAPNITSGVTTSSASVSLWSSTTLIQGDFIEFVLSSMTGSATWISILLTATRSIP